MRLLVLGVVLGSIAIGSCGDRDDRLVEMSDFSGPYFVGDRIVYLDGAFDELLVLKANEADETPEWDRIPVAEDAKLVGFVEAEGAVLLRSQSAGTVEAVYPASGKTKAFESSSPYDRNVVTEDPPMVAAYYSDNAEGDEDHLVLSKGEISFFDLSSEKGSLTTTQVKTFGGAPLGIDVAPAIDLGGKTRQIAFVRWNSYVTILEVGKNAAKPILVALHAPDVTTPVFPGPIQFVLDGSLLRAFFLAVGTPDLYMIEVDTVALSKDTVHVNLFPTGAGPSMFAPFVAADGTLTVVVPCTTARMVVVVRPESSQVVQYPVEIVPRNVSLFRLPGTGEWGAFVYDSAGAEYSYYFVELDALAEKKSKAFHRYSLLAPIQRVYLLGDGETFLVFHSAAGKASLVSVADGSVNELKAPTIWTEVFNQDHTRMYALGTTGGKQYALSFKFLEGGQYEQSSINVTVPATLGSTGGLTLFEDQDLLAIATTGKGVILLPADLKDKERLDALQIVAPFFIGLEH